MPLLGAEHAKYPSSGTLHVRAVSPFCTALLSVSKYSRATVVVGLRRYSLTLGSLASTGWPPAVVRRNSWGLGDGVDSGMR